TKASSPTAAVVPWVNRPLPLYVTPSEQLIRYPASAPACRSGQLRVRQGRGGVGLGNRLERIVFINTGPGRCLLRGYPTITGVTSSGNRRTLRPIRGSGGGTYFGRLVPADMARSEEHTSELQSRGHLVCRLLLEKKKNKTSQGPSTKID